MRTCLNDEVVQDYIDRMAAGDVFPPIVVFQDGVKYWLADGFHRFRARCSSYAETISAEVHVGTLSDAIAYAVGANKANGLRRTNADKRMAVRAALAHEALRLLSDRQIAIIVGVHNDTVSRMRNGESVALSESDSAPQPAESTRARSSRIGRDGRSRRQPFNGRPHARKASPDLDTSAPAPKRSRSATNQESRICPRCSGTGRIQGETK